MSDEIPNLNATPRDRVVPFTQYIRPNGKIRAVLFPTTAEVQKKANEINDAGFLLTVEDIGNSLVNVCICDDDRDYVNEVKQNNSTLPAQIDNMIMHASIPAMVRECEEQDA